MAVEELGKPAVTDPGALSEDGPVASELVKPALDLGVDLTADGSVGGVVAGIGEGVIHNAPMVGKISQGVKEHFPIRAGETAEVMPSPPVNAVLAENLTFFMQQRRLSQNALGKLAGLDQRTVGNYCKPELREPVGKTGKPRSAKLTEVEMLAKALNVEPWELLRHYAPGERDFYAQIEESFRKLRSSARKLEPDAAAPAASKRAHHDQ